MLSDYAELMIRREVLILETINVEQKFSYDMLCEDIGIQRYQLLEMLADLRDNYQLSFGVQDDVVHLQTEYYKVEEIAKQLYNSSLFFRCLRQLLLNRREKNMTQISKELMISQSTGYRLMKKIKQALSNYGLEVVRGIVVGDEMKMRMLIAILESKYGLEIYHYDKRDYRWIYDWITQANGGLDRQNVLDNPRQWSYFEKLVIVGIIREHKGYSLVESPVFQRDIGTQKWWLSDYIRDEINKYVDFSQLSLNNEVTFINYLAGVMVITKTMFFHSKFTAESRQKSYDYAFSSSHYRRLKANLETTFKTDFYNSDILRHLLFDIYRETLFDQYLFREECELEIYFAQRDQEVHPLLYRLVKQVFKRSFTTPVPDVYLRKVAMVLQGYFMEQLDLRCPINILENGHTIYETLKSDMALSGDAYEICKIVPNQATMATLTAQGNQLIIVTPDFWEYLDQFSLGPNTVVIRMVKSQTLAMMGEVYQRFLEVLLRQFDTQITMFLGR